MKKINRQGIEFLVYNDSSNEIANFWEITSWEENNYVIVKDYASKCKTFVNAGGWIGPFTLFASKLYEKVYSLEPDPLAFEELANNVELNKFSNVCIENKALFDGSKKEITMGSDFSPLGRSGTSIFQKDKSVTVPCITLKEYFSKNSIPTGSFFMLDVEGAEYVLFDDLLFFNEYKPILLVEFHLKFLDDINFDKLMVALNNLKPLYKIDISYLQSNRHNIVHQLILPA